MTTFEPYVLSPLDRHKLRTLAGAVAELAARPEQAFKEAKWRRHNQLLTTEPLVYMEPENGWHEIIPPERLECQHEVARAWEFQLRRALVAGLEFQDDQVIEPFFRLPYRFTDTGWGLSQTMHHPGHGGAYAWDAAMASYDDLDRLQFPDYLIDEQGSDWDERVATMIFGDLLPIQRRTSWFWTLGMTWTLAHLRGLETIMLDLFDEPDNLHRLMAFLRDGTLRRIQWLEDGGWLSPNQDGTYVGSGGFGWTDELPVASGTDGRTLLADQWGFAESQETVGLSPEHFAEFILPYQIPLLDRYGLVCYGCCEPLDQRWRYVREIPRLRRVSVSPWANVEFMADQLRDDYVFSWKPNPTMITAPEFHPDRVLADLTHGLRHAQGCCVEVIMKDTHTLGGDPSRPAQWVQLARRAIDAVHG